MKKVVCIILICALLAGTITAGFIAYGPGDNAEADDKRQVSDFFYIQIYDANDRVVSRYKVTLSGTVCAGTREITGVTFNLESGDVCETIQQIDGDMVGIVITHPTEGYLMRVFILDENGVFSEY